MMGVADAVEDEYQPARQPRCSTGRRARFVQVGATPAVCDDLNERISLELVERQATFAVFRRARRRRLSVLRFRQAM